MRSQKGFTAAEGLLIVLVVAVVGFGGYYVWNNQKNKNTEIKSPVSSTSAKNAETSFKTYTDPTKTFSLSYPSTWSVGEEGLGDGGGNVLPDVLNKLAATFTPPNSPLISTNPNNPNKIRITSWKTSDTKSILGIFSTGDTNQPVPKDIMINNYPALYHQSYSTAKKATYTDDDYAVTHNGITVVFSFREKQGEIKYTSLPENNVPAYDASDTVSAFTALVKSIKFID